MGQSVSTGNSTFMGQDGDRDGKDLQALMEGCLGLGTGYLKTGDQDYQVLLDASDSGSPLEGRISYPLRGADEP